MKKLFAILAAVLLTASVFAQSPEKMSYQAVVRNASNNLVTNATVEMQISILQGTSIGTAVYTEKQTPTTNANGLVTLEIGNGTVVNGNFATIDWANGPYFIKTETGPTGETGYTITGTSQLLSVPYALHAKTAETITSGITETDPIYTNSQAANITESDITNLSNLSGVNTGDQDGSETKLTAGTNVSVTGTGTAATPYMVNAVISMTQAQRDSLTATEGMIVYNSTTHKPNYYNGTGWMNYDGTSAKTLAVGVSHQGGIIAYILHSGDTGYDANIMHGIIAAPSDQSTSIQWYNDSNTTTGATAVAIGTGEANTNTIVSNQGTGHYAAKLCFDLVLGGYNDWYLPSKYELYELYLNQTLIGGFASGLYWSSTEYDNQAAFLVYFLNGVVNGTLKNSTEHVRAVRSF